MYFPFFIVKRFIFSKKKSRFINLISFISITGIAIGVATLIIAISVLKGFEKTLTDKIIGFDSHIKITSFRSVLPDEQKNIAFLNEHLKAYDPKIIPFASKLVIISSKKRKEGLNLIGVDKDSNVPGVVRNMVKGSFDLSDSKNKNIIIGKRLADKLYLKQNDRVTVFSLNNDEIPSPQNLPNIAKFIVAGIFESGMSKFDDSYAYISLSEAQELFGIGNNITGYDIKLNDISKIDSLTYYLADNLRYPHHVRNIYQIYRNIFTWIELQKEPIPIVLALIIIVAVFNIIGTLLMIVLEKTNEVGILKSIGASRKQVISIFLFEGIFLGFVGIAAGNFLAYTLMKIQLESNIITLPSSVYFMSKVPLLILPDSFFLISIVTILLCIVASTVPGFIASKIKPISALRFS
jgi:lipoprotein-releasing system permease protein